MVTKIKGSGVEFPDNVEQTEGVESPIADIYRKENLLGTVSQSGGVPTGAVIESYVSGDFTVKKLADGTMIMTHEYSGVIGTGNSLGVQFGTLAYQIVFPENFTRLDSFTGAMTVATSSAGVAADFNFGTRAIDLINGDMIICWKSISGAGSTQSFTARTTLIGRWF